MNSTCQTFCLAGMGLLMSVMWGHAAAPVPVKTYTYKRVGELAIQADVYAYDDNVKRPCVVWVHGGALIMGNRTGIDSRMRAIVLEAGYVLVSIDYRLAPEVKLPAIISDLEDALKWVRAEGPKLFKADPNRIAVCGGSAGGYLTLAAGHRVQPRPRALISLFGYGDIVGDWYSKPSPHPRHHTTKLSEAEARQLVSGPVVADDRQRPNRAGGFYNFCRQQGIWPKEVTGWDPVVERSKFEPYMPVKNVTADYPPTLMIHGTADTDVPFEQSALMAEQMKRHGVVHELFVIPNGEHGFGGGDPAVIAKAYERAREFLKQNLE